MNIVFKKIRYKNLLSTGNLFTEIDLNSHHSTLISGTNGEGKSTIIDAIIFALYGKPYRKINKNQLLNSINNKELVVELEFVSNSNLYLIRRGIKPNIFEIFKDGVLLDQDAAKRDYQEYLEKNILKMTYKSFTQIVILGSATYTPFMDLPAGGRREIIEDLLDIEIFTKMNNLLKEKISANKNELLENSHQIDLQKTKIDAAKNHNKELMALKLVEADKIKEKINNHLNKISEEKEKISILEKEIEEYQETIQDKEKIESRLSKMKELQSDLSSKLRTLETNLNFYHDNDHCPTCKQGIAHDFKEETIHASEKQKAELIEAKQLLTEKIDKLKERMAEIAEVEGKILAIERKTYEHKSNISSSKHALNDYKRDLESAQKEAELITESRIEELETFLAEIHKKQEKLTETREIYAISALMLKDGGIKTRIIQQYIPIMNSLINKYLSIFELFVDFNLDETFNEVIKSRHRDTFSYSSFSEGEKLRINLCILFAWRTIAKMRNSVSTNLLFFDEILDGAMDTTGVETLLETLKTLNESDNIFIISHRGQDYGEKFDNHIRFKKIKNFSRIVE